MQLACQLCITNILIIKGDPASHQGELKEKTTNFVFSCQIMSTNLVEATETGPPSSALKITFKA